MYGTAEGNDMYVASKTADRWKGIHWLQIDKRRWEATHGPDTQRWAYLREAKGGDGKSWPEWTGEEGPYHHDNKAREEARRELEKDITPFFLLLLHPAARSSGS
jgi:hypothetical protein